MDGQKTPQDASLTDPRAQAQLAAAGGDEVWYANGLRFKCTQCGNCCTGGPGYVWFTEEEGAAMAAAAGVDVREFYQRYAKRKFGRWTLEEVKYKRTQYDCVFLARDEKGRGKCSIYHARPTQCRTWPFWASNLSHPREWARAAEDCPGMKLPGDPGGTFVPIENIRIELAKNPDGL